MKRFSLLAALSLLIAAPIAFAQTTIVTTVNFDVPITGGAPDGYRLYVDDCAASGPTAAPVGTVTSGQEFTGILPGVGTYDVCVRPFNATGELADPGPVANVVIGAALPGPVENLDVIITCRDSGGSTVSCSAAGLNVTVTIN